MIPVPQFPDRLPEMPTIVTLLPGPDRKRGTSLYHYRVTYRNPEPGAVGCVMLWEVRGGRSTYQVALERDEKGNLRPHCTCADAVYRSELEGHFCKHIHGMLQFSRPAYPLPEPRRTA
jgi:hypothetical protein